MDKWQLISLIGHNLPLVLICLQRFIAVCLGVMSLVVFKSLAENLESGAIPDLTAPAPPKSAKWYIFWVPKIPKTTCQTRRKICLRLAFNDHICLFEPMGLLLLKQGHLRSFPKALLVCL